MKINNGELGILYVLIKMLLKGKRLNTFLFQELTDSQRLAARIHYLQKKLKWRINKRWIFYAPIGRSIKEYWLEPEEINRIQNKKAASSSSRPSN